MSISSQFILFIYPLLFNFTRFKDLEEGILPVEEGEEETGDALSKRDLSLAVQQLESLETGKKKKRKKKKKKSQGDTIGKYNISIYCNQSSIVMM